jgi:L-ascorbate metabolism protein UlaG (beta-lactamase superfamily)
MKKHSHAMVLILIFLVGSLTLGACAYLQYPKFGKLPEGDRLEIVKRSPNYANGEFKNLIATPMFSDDSSVVGVIFRNLLTKGERLTPSVPMPSVKTDLKTLDRDMDTVIWLGHSSYFVQLGGKRILIDPVFSLYAAPVPFANKAFDGTSLYTAEDMPKIDYLLVTHDHWDHLDYPSVKALESKTRHVVTGLGVGAYFEHWGYPKQKIHEADWFGALELEPGLTIHVLPARHYSGRLLTRNKTLWSAFALETPTRRIFFSGDSGYGPHFGDIARKFNGFDLVVLDTGQYDERWAFIHMTPEEAAQAAEVLKAKALLPGHIGKFTIARHTWDDPFRRISVAIEGRNYRLLTPKIGERVSIGNENQRYYRWWESIE